MAKDARDKGREGREGRGGPEGGESQGAGRRRRGPPASTAPVVRRRSSDRGERKALPEELEAFAAGDDDALWRKTRERRRVRDPRPVALVPGVKNSDARIVYEARLERIKEAIEAGDEAALGRELVEAYWLRIWRAYSIVSWEVFVEEILGYPIEKATALASRVAASRGQTLSHWEEDPVARWLRTEAGLLEAGGGRVWIAGSGPSAVLRLEVPLDRAYAGLAAAGWRAAPLVQEEAASRTYVDRPKGVPRLSRLIELDRPKGGEDE